MGRSRRILKLPHAQRPCWFSPDNRSDLWYLGWGLRNFHENPTVSGAATRSRERGGWGYVLILRGSPTILLADGPLRLSANQAIITAPPRNYTAGFRDDADEHCEILVWVWRTPPVVTEVSPRPRGYSLFMVNEHTRKRLQAAHAVCRSEAANPDRFSARLLRSVRCQIETELARCSGTRPATSSQEKLAQTAARWMELHFHQPNPILLLCDYLQVSRSTLNRLFAEHFDKSPSQHRLELRMHKAADMVRDGTRSIKDIAFALGYKHPNNFSRAFRTFQAAKRSR